MALDFEWDENKARENIKNHKVSFHEAISMKKAIDRSAQDDDLRAEYDFTGGVRGKYYETMQAGYTITIHKADGSTVIKEVTPRKDTIVLEPDVQSYFPDSKSVNTALRSLISLIPAKRKTITRKARISGAQRRITLSTRSKSTGERGR
jgi:uncharacterized DUF497 family protein